MQIAILLYNGFTALDAVGPYEVLVSLPDTQVHFDASLGAAVVGFVSTASLIAAGGLAASCSVAGALPHATRKPIKRDSVKPCIFMTAVLPPMS